MEDGLGVGELGGFLEVGLGDEGVDFGLGAGAHEPGLVLVVVEGTGDEF